MNLVDHGQESPLEAASDGGRVDSFGEEQAASEGEDDGEDDADIETEAETEEEDDGGGGGNGGGENGGGGKGGWSDESPARTDAAKRTGDDVWDEGEGGEGGEGGGGGGDDEFDAMYGGMFRPLEDDPDAEAAAAEEVVAPEGVQ
jgi:hypothetical protein